MLNKSLIVPIVILFLASACKEEDPSVSRITTTQISQTWIPVYEKRISDNWVQSDENGITTDWEVDTQFGSKINIRAVKFGDDGTFSWNIATAEDWEYWLKIRDNLPEGFLSTYSLSHDGRSIVLYSRFNYVGIVTTDTAHFQIAINHDGRLVLENQEVKLEFIDNGQYR
jgi:hypothetical protein